MSAEDCQSRPASASHLHQVVLPRLPQQRGHCRHDTAEGIEIRLSEAYIAMQDAVRFVRCLEANVIGASGCTRRAVIQNGKLLRVARRRLFAEPLPMLLLFEILSKRFPHKSESGRANVGKSRDGTGTVLLGSISPFAESGLSPNLTVVPRAIAKPSNAAWTEAKEREDASTCKKHSRRLPLPLGSC
eukprot:scaffold1436_cov250-Pinguiococcus_pyrenoidosus.AAC.7